MLDSEKQVQQRLPIPLPKVKFESPNKVSTFDDETDDDVLTATPNASDPVDSGPWLTRSMHSLPASMPIGMSCKSTKLP